MYKKMITVFFLLLLMGVNSVYSEELFPKNRPLLEVASPTEWSFHKFVEQPISLYRGAISVDIPLYTVKDGEAEIPLVLRYNTSGIKVSEEAGWVGLGWNLDVGGYITCNVVDGYDWRDDTYDSSYKLMFYPSNHGIVYNHDGCQETEDMWNNMPYLSQDSDNYHWGKLAPDVYYYSFPGGAGRYVMDYRDYSVVLLQRGTALKISNGSANEEFPSKTITTTRGIVHEYDYFSSNTRHGSFIPLSVSYALTKTRYPSGGEVNYNYSTLSYRDTLMSCGVVGMLTQSDGGIDTSGYDSYSSIIRDVSFINKKEALLSSIQTQNYVIEFITSPREDHPVLKKLDIIRIRAGQTGPILKQYEFTYGYFYPEGNTVTNAHQQLRLKLLSVKAVSVTDNSEAENYTFVYNETSLPEKSSLAIDHWGYANNTTGPVRGNYLPNLSGLKGLYYQDNDYNILKNAPQPKYNPDHNRVNCASGMLTEIHYPDGGKTTFLFESNTFWGKKIQSVGEGQNVEYESETITDRNNANDTRAFFISPSSTAYVTIAYELNRGLNTWSDLYGSKIRIPFTSGTGDSPHVLVDLDGECYQKFISGNTDQAIYGSISFERPAGVTTFSVDIPDALGDQHGASLNHAYLTATITYSTTPPIDYGSDGMSYGCGMRIKEIHHYELGSESPKSVRVYSYDSPESGHTSGILFDYPQYAEKYQRVGYSYIVSLEQFSPFVETPRQFFMGDRPIERNPYGWSYGVGYGYVRETIQGIGGYTEYYFQNDEIQDVNYSYRVGKPKNGKLLEKRILNSAGVVVKKELNEYLVKHTKYYYGVNLINTWNKFPILIKPGYGTWSTGLYEANHPVFYPNFHIILEYALNQSDVLLMKKTDILDGVTRETSWTYDDSTLLPKTEALTNSDGRVIQKRMTYPYDCNDFTNGILTSKNIIEYPVEISMYVNNDKVEAEYREYDENGKPEVIKYLDTGAVSEYPVSDYVCLEKDARGNPLGYTVGETYDEVYIWGYKWRYPVAKITGASYSSVKAALSVASLKAFSAESVPDMSMFDALRSSLPEASIWTWTYDELGNITTATTPDGVRKTYTYDGFGRLTSEGVMSELVEHVLERYDYSDDMVSRSSLWDPAEGRQVKDIIYSNGLGLPSQIIRTQFTAAGKTIVESLSYDSALRKNAELLPYAIIDTTGIRQINTFSNTLGYWHTRFPGEGNFQLRTVYESAPFERVSGQHNPGYAYYYGNKGIKTQYRSNTTQEVFNLSVLESGELINSGYYQSGLLYCTETTDEDGVKRIEYSDKFGFLVMTRRFVGENTADTYYVRDNHYNLCVVLTPKGAAMINSAGLYPETHPSVSKLSYVYKYEGKGRMVERRFPTSGSEYIVYDKAGRMVAKQTANDRANSVWRTYVLDGNGRIIRETRRVSNLSRQEFQASFDTVCGTGTIVQSFKYGGYSSSPLSVFSPVSGIVSASDVNFSITGVLTEEMLSEVGSGETLNPVYHKKYHFYDKYGREVQNVISLNGHSVSNSVKYDYRGNVTKRVETVDSLSKEESITYDLRGRRTEEISIIDGPSPIIMSVQYGYDDLGKQNLKVFGNGVEESWEYNLQGWRKKQTVFNGASPLFEETIKYYDTGTGVPPSYAGRITGRIVTRDGVTLPEYYRYDSAGRLLGGGHEPDITYDLNGNIMTLRRDVSGTSSALQSWSYDGNRRNGYVYDDEGNIVSLVNVNTITYNWLGLPSSVSYGAGVRNYIYLSDGTKISSTDNMGTGYLYLGSRRYSKVGQTATLESLSMPCGRIIKSASNTYVPNYFTYDYLGNVRLVTDATGNVVYESDYTPLGAPYNQSGTSVGFTFGGKESQPLGGFLDFGARFYYPGGALWLSQDPESEKYYELSPYSYCASNPLLYVDKTGNIFETAWDAYSLASGINSLVKNVKEGKVGAAILDGVGVVADAAALVMPIVPGGVGAAIKGVRTADKGIDMARMKRILATHMPEQLKRGRITEILLLAEKGFTKNTKKFTTFVDDKSINVIPDIFNDTDHIVGEIKDVAELAATDQIKAEISLAKQLGYNYKLFVEEGTKLSSGLLEELKNYEKIEVVRFKRKDLWKAFSDIN